MPLELSPRFKVLTFDKVFSPTASMSKLTFSIGIILD